MIYKKVKHDYVHGDNADSLAEDTGEVLANGEASGSGDDAGSIWQRKTDDDDYFSRSTFFYDDDYSYFWQDDDYGGFHGEFAQAGNLACNILNFLCTIVVVVILRPCQQYESPRAMRWAIGLSAVSNLLFLTSSILTFLDWEACYPNYGLYPTFAFWFAPLLIFMESRLLRAAVAIERGDWPEQEEGGAGTLGATSFVRETHSFLMLFVIFLKCTHARVRILYHLRGQRGRSRQR